MSITIQIKRCRLCGKKYFYNPDIGSGVLGICGKCCNNQSKSNWIKKIIKKGELSMWKRGQREANLSDLCKQVTKERDFFHYKVISGDRESIYQNCNIIRFYECIYEYFLYCETIKNEVIQSLIQTDDILNELYHFYLDNECECVDTWVEIEKMLDNYLEATTTKSDN